MRGAHIYEAGEMWTDSINDCDESVPRIGIALAIYRPVRMKTKLVDIPRAVAIFFTESVTVL